MFLKRRKAFQIAQWPVELRPWLPASILVKMQLPELDDSCPLNLRQQSGLELVIRNMDASTRLYLPDKGGVSVDLMAEGGQGAYVWLINGETVGVDTERRGLRYTFERAGDYDVTVFDTAGAVDKIPLRVISR